VHTDVLGHPESSPSSIDCGSGRGAPADEPRTHRYDVQRLLLLVVLVLEAASAGGLLVLHATLAALLATLAAATTTALLSTLAAALTTATAFTATHAHAILLLALVALATLATLGTTAIATAISIGAHHASDARVVSGTAG
jgi:hypothetical protein